MVTAKEELVAAGIRKQMAYLEGLLEELMSDPVKDKDISKQIKEVEAQIRDLRGKL